MDKENLSAADRIINTLITFSSHAHHGRPGIVTTDPTSPIGVKWSPVTHKVEEGQRVVYEMSRIARTTVMAPTDVGRKTTYQKKKNPRQTVLVKLGVIQPNNQIKDGDRIVGDYRKPGLFPEVVAHLYRQVAEVWKLDNEFAARWASYAFGEDHRDLKCILAAFMLVQSRKGDPVKDAGKIAFYDEDYRDIGEAMFLIEQKSKDKDKEKKDLNPKMFLRIHDILVSPKVAEINRELGFGLSARNAFVGRWPKAVEKYLRHREENPKLLHGLVKGGFGSQIRDLASRIGYKPNNPKFFQTLRWEQEQSKNGHRTMAIGVAVKAADSWEGLSEEQICQKILKDRPNYKRLVGMLPADPGMTRAIMAATIEAKCLSNKDLIILTPTLEDLGLLNVQAIREIWERAVKAAEDMRAVNIAMRVKNTATKEILQQGADAALQKAVAVAVRNLRIYFMVDISGSMAASLETAKEYLAKIVQAFPLDKLHVNTFNTISRDITIPVASAVGVEQAFRGVSPGGGTSYGAAVRGMAKFKPADGEDAIFFFVGDEEDSRNFDYEVRGLGWMPCAFGLIRTPNANGHVVTQTAAVLGIPCLQLSNEIFADPYAVPRTLNNLISSTPVGQPTVYRPAAVVRETLAEQIAKFELLKKPAWAA